MLHKTHGRIVVGLLVIAVLAVVIALAAAQGHKAMAQVPPGMSDMAPPAPRNMPQPPGGGPGMPGMMGMMGSAAVAANTKYVYVLVGNTLYQFNAETLRQVGKVSIERTAAPRMMPMPTPKEKEQEEDTSER